MKFDGCGNRTNLNGAPESYNNMNQPEDVPHDNEGNVQSYKGWTYAYDAQNRLKQATSAMLTVQFYYDGLNRQVARVETGNVSSPAPTPTVAPLISPTPSIPPLPTATPALNTPTVPPINTPTPSSGSPLGKCAVVTFSGQTGYRVAMSTATQDATIFYTTDYSKPTHNGSNPTGTTRVYSAPVFVGACNEMYFEAVAYKLGMDDSDVRTFDARNMSACSGAGGGGSTSAITLSVWDGDWALLEEYSFNGTSSTILQKYVQGYHGLVKTLVDNFYYYQDELGSTSHVANASGNLIEYYRYDLYGRPLYFAPPVQGQPPQQLTSSAYGVVDLGDGGGRWMAELGLYDDRNRFMSPDLGRFIQPDPIGFKGDASNLYRYCGNDWANRTDPMGLEFIDHGETFGQYTVPEAYGYTQPKLEPVGVSFTKDEGGVQAHVKDFNLSVKSVVGQKIQCVKNGKLVWLGRDPKNVQRTSKHEAEHREHNRQWYNQNHDRVLGELNNGERFKDEQSAEKAVKEKLLKDFKDFNKREHDHLPPNWNNYKPVDECAQQRQAPQAAQVEPNAEPHDTKWYGSTDYLNGVGSTSDIKPK